MIAVAGGFGSDYARIDDLCAQLHMDIAVLQSGWVIEDFQTVTGSRSSDGDLLKKTIVSPRQYIANAYFVAAISSAVADLDEIAGWLRRPKGIVSLGRTCCIPAAPLNPRFAEALPVCLKAYRQCLPLDTGSVNLNDRYISSRYRMFGPRWVREVMNVSN